MGWDLVIALVAAIALVQPWLVWIYRSYVRKGSAEFYESGKLTIYFWSAGCGLELAGTVKANHQDQFLRSIGIHIVRGNNLSTHDFEWRSFRYPVVDFQGISKSTFDIASSLMVTVASPQYLATFFVDPTSEQELETIRDQVTATWRIYFENRQAEVAAAFAPLPQPPEDVGPLAFLAQHQQQVPPTLDVNLVFEDFAQTADVVAQKANLDRECYWRTGDYNFTLNLVTDQPHKTFVHHGTFQLTDQDVRALRNNSDALLRAWCEVPIPSTPKSPAVGFQLQRP